MVLLGITAALPAGAQTIPSALPTSSNPATGLWIKMHPSSFAGTSKSAFEQCYRDAVLEKADPLTLEKCQEFQVMLERGLCESVMVPDGVVHDFMNGRTNGQSKVTRNVEKQIGRHDRALLCNLGDGVYGYWYTGIRGQSCNNVAFTFVVPPAPPPPPEVQTEKKCRFVKRAVKEIPSTFVHVQDFNSCGCYIPGVTVVVPGGTQTNSSLVCE